MIRLLATLLVLLVLGAQARAAGGGIELREAGQAVFPERSYVVTLPERRSLTARDVEVTENGRPVHDIRLERGTASSTGVVLTIDASKSMRGGAMDDAMAAARAFAERRRPEQKLGVVFFSREPTVALEPTTDGARIAEVLGTTPKLSRGTQIHDAARVAVGLLEAADVAAGTVVVLSDGADAGSALNAGDVAAAARAAKVSVHAVGLRSPSYDGGALAAITANGGRHVESPTSRELAGIFAQLGERLAGEYVVSWTSLAAAGARVAVGIEIDGYPGMVTAAYEVPDLRTRPASPAAPGASIWRSPAVAVAVAVLVALLVGLSIVLLVRERRKTVGERISSFVFEREAALPDVHRDAPGLLERLDQALQGRRLWDDYRLDVELTRLRPTAPQLALAVLATTALVGAGAWALGRPVIAALAVLGVPAIARFAVRTLANRVRKRFAEQLPDNLQVMSSALRAGHSFVGALKTMVHDAPEPSKSEYRRVLLDEQLGVAIEDSLKVVGERMRNEEVAYVGLIATLQRETGGNTAEVLDRVVVTIRERMKLRRLISTLTAQGRLGGWIVTALPIAMVVFLNVVKPDYMDPMTATPMGWVVLGFGALMVVLGAFAIRKIVDIKV